MPDATPSEATTQSEKAVDRRRKWTADDRAQALEAYYRTGSRRKVCKELGVPPRTLSGWLTDPRHAEERQAVQTGLQRALEKQAEQRGRELAEATSEAILVCRKALRGNPDGKTASSLLTALSRTREMEDRIHRLDEGMSTEIHGVSMSPEDREAFKQWYRQRQEQDSWGAEEWRGESERLVARSMDMALERPELVHAVLQRLGQADRLKAALRGDPELARQLHDALGEAVLFAEETALAGDTSVGGLPGTVEGVVDEVR